MTSLGARLPNGLDLRKVREFDPNGRPQYPVEPDTLPLREVT